MARTRDGRGRKIRRRGKGWAFIFMGENDDHKEATFGSTMGGKRSSSGII